MCELVEEAFTIVLLAEGRGIQKSVSRLYVVSLGLICFLAALRFGWVLALSLWDCISRAEKFGLLARYATLLHCIYLADQES